MAVFNKHLANRDRKGKGWVLSECVVAGRRLFERIVDTRLRMYTCAWDVKVLGLWVDTFSIRRGPLEWQP